MQSKTRPPWLLVAMSHILIIIATSAFKFSRSKNDEINEDVHLTKLILRINSLNQTTILYNLLYILKMEKTNGTKC